MSDILNMCTSKADNLSGAMLTAASSRPLRTICFHAFRAFFVVRVGAVFLVPRATRKDSGFPACGRLLAGGSAHQALCVMLKVPRGQVPDEVEHLCGVGAVSHLFIEAALPILVHCRLLAIVVL